jgi:hypothetical protein
MQAKQGGICRPVSRELHALLIVHVNQASFLRDWATCYQYMFAAQTLSPGTRLRANGPLLDVQECTSKLNVVV